MDGMKAKLDEATAQLNRLKATHGKHEEDLGERQPYCPSVTSSVKSIAHRIHCRVRLRCFMVALLPECR